MASCILWTYSPPPPPDLSGRRRAGPQITIGEPARVSGKRRPEFPELTLLEAHFTSIDHPLTNHYRNPRHIPGALQVHPSYLEAGTNEAKYYPFYECPADGNLLPEGELQRAIERLEITPDTLVVVYGSEPDGTMAAARLVWGLMYAGVKTIRLLDGGLDAWLADGGATESRIELASKIARGDDRIAPSLSTWKVRSDLLATTNEVSAITAAAGHPASKLIDVRRRGEWDGTVTDYYTFFSKAGHIPTAVYHGDWRNLLEAATYRLGPRIDAVAERWRAQGILDTGVEQRTTTLIFYCGTGWRSSIAFLVALLLGLRTKNYDDGFYGWSGRVENVAHGTAFICCAS